MEGTDRLHGSRTGAHGTREGLALGKRNVGGPFAGYRQLFS